MPPIGQNIGAEAAPWRGEMDLMGFAIFSIMDSHSQGMPYRRKE